MKKQYHTCLLKWPYITASLFLLLISANQAQAIGLNVRWTEMKVGASDVPRCPDISLPCSYKFQGDNFTVDYALCSKDKRYGDPGCDDKAAAGHTEISFTVASTTTSDECNKKGSIKSRGKTCSIPYTGLLADTTLKYYLDNDPDVTRFGLEVPYYYPTIGDACPAAMITAARLKIIGLVCNYGLDEFGNCNPDADLNDGIPPFAPWLNAYKIYQDGGLFTGLLGDNLCPTGEYKGNATTVCYNKAPPYNCSPTFDF